MQRRSRKIVANKTDAGNGSYGICRVINASRSPSPDPRRSPKQQSPFAMQDESKSATEFRNPVWVPILMSLLSVSSFCIFCLQLSSGPSWTGAFYFAFGVGCSLAVWEAAKLQVNLYADRLENTTGFSKRTVNRRAIQEVRSEKGCPPMLLLSDGSWFRLQIPWRDARPLVSAIRRWVSDAKQSEPAQQ